MDGLVSELQRIPVFRDLPVEGLQWLASNMTVEEFEPGQILAREGETAGHLTVILEGEFTGHAESRPNDGREYRAVAGQVTGMLPYSRLTAYPLTTRAVTPGRVAKFPAGRFSEMLERLPALGGRLVSVLADRVRETTRADEQREKMAALGKLSAGLAHELNNPSAAARRAAENLTEAVAALHQANLELDQMPLTPDQRAYIARLEWGPPRDSAATPVDSLERSDREEQIAAWLEERHVDGPWELAANLVDSGCGLDTLAQLARRFDSTALASVVTRVAASFSISRLASEIESSTARISELVRSVKEYSYMDQAPEQEVDIHGGIENTLVMLRYRLKHGVAVERDYDRSLPKICAHGSELNQVWTNLIENAIDAMSGQGTLRIRTAREFDRVLVEIGDDGPGVPQEIRARIFEPFFTTKGVGEGSGLGLDIAYRIVQKHRGDIRVESQPGDTRFQVRLPFAHGWKGESKP
jgi:signal transduction histidine kinase